MNIREMHFDYKQKLNVADSQKYRGLKVPEIDWKLNEAQNLYVKMVAEPRIQSLLGFELNQRTIDDIRTVVVDQTFANGIVPTLYDAEEKSYIATLPIEYSFYVKGRCYADKGTCLRQRMRVVETQHDDESEISVLDNSNFEWRVMNIQFNKDGILMFTDKTFEPKKLCLSYIKKLAYIHNAADFVGGTYKLLDGTVLTGRVDCELPVSTHPEIVDLAVYITAHDLNLASFGIKQNKVKINI